MVALGRLKEFDPASRNHRIRGLVGGHTAALPLRSYTWPVGTWLNQRSEGACVSFTLNHELLAVPKRIWRTEEDARVDYYEIQKRDPWEGGAYPGADPVYEGTSVLSGVKYMQEKGFYTGYKWAFDEQELAWAVGHQGPCIIGVNWYEGMFAPDESGFLQKTGSLIGGHCTLLHGISVGGDYYWIWNSWGREWGINGRAKITRQTLRDLLAEEGEAVLPIRA